MFKSIILISLNYVLINCSNDSFFFYYFSSLTTLINFLLEELGPEVALMDFRLLFFLFFLFALLTIRQQFTVHKGIFDLYQSFGID
jgi:hypothetical protein